MNRYGTRAASESGGFATSFSDMVFGLLFVFFLLSIALIFQRPEVDAFQDKIDALQNELQDKTAALARVNANRVALEKANTRLHKQVESLASSRDKLRETKNQQREQLLESRKQIQAKAQTSIRELRVQLTASRQKANRLQAALERARRQLVAANPEQLRKVLRATRANVDKLEKANERLARDKREFRAMLDSIKRLLRGAGQIDILAEVNQMERNLLDRGDGSGADPLQASSNLSVRFDPSQGLFGAELQRPGSDAEFWGALPEDELLRIASELGEEFEANSAAYTELEKREHQPRILLSVHPDTPYWQVQELLERMRGTIPVSIVPWE